MKSLASLYSLRYPTSLVYMLQNVEYEAWPYLKWYWRVPDFRTVMYRRTLDRTGAAKLLLLALRVGMVMQIAVGIGLVAAWYAYGWLLNSWPVWWIGAILIVTYPIIWALLAVVPLTLGKILIVLPRQRQLINQAEHIFQSHKGVKLAIVGSYGKTSMKELLLTVLSQSKNVAATPANKNVSISHAVFATKLNGDEDVLLLEYGEGRPGDISRFARLTHPTHAVITGIAPAHLDRYKSLAAAARDIFSVAQAIPTDRIYVNADSKEAAARIVKPMQSYDSRKVFGWKIGKVKLSVDGTSFTMTNVPVRPRGRPRKNHDEQAADKATASSSPKRQMTLHSSLIGRHQVGPLAFAAAFGVEIGMTERQVVEGIAATAPFEHRMQPYKLNGGWIIDDTYNGNLEGIRAGTSLLRELQAERKWYVTPGLVDQGKENSRIHRQMGELIAACKPDIVVLMENSVTAFIEAGLRAGDYDGELRIETDPLHFYTNLSYFVAAGDLVLMQNDWTDNYA